MEYIEQTYPGVRSYSLPSVGWSNADGTAVRPHIEFGIKAEGEAVQLLDAAWKEVSDNLDAMGVERKIGRMNSSALRDILRKVKYAISD